MYYGVVALDPAQFTVDGADAASSAANGNAKAPVLPAVLSIGYNPFYKNTVRSVVCMTLSVFSAICRDSVYLSEESNRKFI